MFGRKPKAGEEQEKLGFFGRLRARLNRGDSFLTRDLGELFRGRQIDAAALEELETRLLTADAGVEATEFILDGLKNRVARKELADVNALIVALRNSVAEILGAVREAARDRRLEEAVRDPGRGRERLRQDHHHRQAGPPPGAGRSPASCSRPATRSARPAMEQLNVWADRSGAAFAAQQAGADPERGRVRRPPVGSLAEDGRAARRHGRPPARPVAPDGRAEEGEARDPARRSDGPARSAARPGREPGSERAIAGHSVSMKRSASRASC